MPHRFVSEGLWNTISAIAKNSAVRRAAIAYVTDANPIRFRAGDTLVTDASETAIASGSTDARVLGTAIDLGAEVYSVRGLHAKVLRLDDVAVIGSGNLSRRSQHELIEAAVISDDARLVAQVDAFIDALQEAGTRITKDGVELLRRIPVVKRRPGSVRDHAVPASKSAVWILGLPEIEVDANEEAVADQVAEVRREEGRDTAVDEFYWPKTQRFARAAKPGDLVISVYRPKYADRTRSTIKVYRPMSIKRVIRAGKYEDAGFVTTMPKRVARRALSWSRFRQIAGAAGVSVNPDCEIQLSERQWQLVDAQWFA